MISKKILVALGVTASAFAPLLAFASGDFTSPADASAVVSGFATNIGTVLYNSLPTIFVVASVLLGVMVVWRIARRAIR